MSPANPNPQDPPPEIIEVDAPIYGKKRPDMSWRDHLVMLLTSGAEVEHALMVQYLYAAYSINGDQPDEERRALVEGWRASILSVAREEMGHLLTVQNILVLLGAPISFDREMMPWDHEFYPFPFTLEKLSEETLQCFIYAEMPRLAVIEQGKTYTETPRLLAMAPGKKREKAVQAINPQIEWACVQEVRAALTKRFGADKINADLHQVGELYNQIIDLISDPARIPDSAFNEASYDMQADWDDWGRGYKPPPRAVTPDGDIDTAAGPRKREASPDFPSSMAHRHAHVQVARAATRADAVKVLRALSAQGEAPHLKQDETGEPSHFERFVQIYEEYKELKKKDPKWSATYDVPKDPTTRDDFARLREGKNTYIPANLESAAAAHLFAQLFNQRYRLLLNYLAHSFQLGRSQALRQPGRRGMVMHRAFGEMYNLKTIAGLLVRMSLHDPKNADAHAGPPFELPYTLDLPQAEIDIWRQHHDLLSASQHVCGEVFRLAKVSDSFKKEVTDVGGDVYLKTLMKLDEDAQRWIGAILAGTN